MGSWMKISTILDHIDGGHMALPEFQRGHVWSREQVRGLLDSLYRRHPVGSLMVWVTEQRTAARRGEYVGCLSRLLGILDIALHVEEVTDPNKSIDVVVEIFNRVNSGGTKLSKGDLALAKICADWPDGRQAMKAELRRWENDGYSFNLDWLLRSVNTVLTGEARFRFLHDKSAEEIRDGLKRAAQHIDTCLNLISGKLGLDHDRVLFGRFAIPVVARWLELRNGDPGEVEGDKILFWFVEAGMWGRFSGSTESYIDQDLAVLEDSGDNLDRLLEQLRLWHGGLRVEAGHFTGWSLGARFYPVLYLLTRMGEARDRGTGLPLNASLLGKKSRLEVHHVFPKAQLYRRGFKRSQVNALANFCFLTKDTNTKISDQLPERYFPVVEARHPGALASQWIPQDPELWKVENLIEFLEARKVLLADETNRCLTELLHGDTEWLGGPPASREMAAVPGGISSEEEEQELIKLNEWVQSRGFPAGAMAYDLSDADSGNQLAVLDLAWPSGLQEQLTEPVAVLLNEEAGTVALASRAGFRCFASTSSFKEYVEHEIVFELQA